MTSSPGDNLGALQEPNFRLYSFGSVISMIGRQMLTVAVGWEIYERTHSAMALGYIGLVQLLPVVLLVLPAGHIVDTQDRRKVLMIAQWVNALAALGLVFTSITSGPVWEMYLWLGLVGLGRAFHSPANSALLPEVVSEANFTNAVTWGSILFQAASILGPALGGMVIGIFHQAYLVYLVDGICSLLFGVVLLLVHSRRQGVMPKKEMTLKTLASGLSFVWNTKMILAAITLDMFAVLFGGAVALLPIFAKDILHVGPGGLGWLQTAPSLGAILMGLILARCPSFRQAGKWLMFAVIGFGIVTVGFGFSRNFWLSFALLAVSGAFDNISVIIRQSLVQLRTPDAMRGRVSAINYVFIGTSNELGGFESGLVAQWFGPVFSVVFGGFATILTVLITGYIWPELRTMDRLEAEPEALVDATVAPN